MGDDKVMGRDEVGESHWEMFERITLAFALMG
jgi:hypothetical protein